MISTLALGPIPELIQSEMGDKALRRVFRASGLTGDLLYMREGYIPEPALVRFFDEFAREAGERWVLGPWVRDIQISDYGLWGDWVLSASTLRDGLLRGCSSIHLHGTLDKLSLATRDGLAEFSYAFAAAAKPGYGELAIGGAAALVSYCRAYVGPNWVPDQIDLNIPDLTRRDLNRLESWFGCRIGPSESVIRLTFDEGVLDRQRRHGAVTALTYEDVVRERSPCHPTTLASQVRSMVRLNLADNLTGIEDIARSLDLAVRTLQQRLGANGESYRDIVKAVRIERAQELLRDGMLSITEIGHELGYEHAPHFTRMFGAEVGMPPSAYARQQRNRWTCTALRTRRK